MGMSIPSAGIAMPVATTPGPADGDCTPGPADGDWADAGEPDGSSGGEAAAVNEGPETADSVGRGTGAGVGLPAELHPPAITRRITSVAIHGRCVLGLMDPALRLLIPRTQGSLPLRSSTALPCTNAHEAQPSNARRASGVRRFLEVAALRYHLHSLSLIHISE